MKRPKGGRLPAGVKIDTLKAMLEVLACEDATNVLAMITQKVVDLQSLRRVSTPKVSATPESIVQAVKSGKISLDELKVALEKTLNSFRLGLFKGEREP